MSIILHQPCIHHLLCGILRYTRETNPSYLNKQDVRLKPLQHTLDALFHKLHAEGHGVQVKHAEILTKEDEAKLWKSGVLRTTSPKSMQNAAFCVAGKMFSLIGGMVERATLKNWEWPGDEASGMEHRTLKLSQLQRMTDPV